MNLVCNIIRGKAIESQHRVYAVVINENGKIIFATGNPDYIMQYAVFHSRQHFSAHHPAFFDFLDSGSFSADSFSSAAC